MKTRNMLMISLTLVLLVGLFVAVGIALAGSSANDSDVCGKSGEPVGDGVIAIKKHVHCVKDKSWDWTITKEADHSSLTLSTGQSYVVNYTVRASATATDSFKVNGSIFIQNVSSAEVKITSVVDSLGAVTCPKSTIPAGQYIECTYNSGKLTSPPSQNVATVEYEGGSKPVVTTSPIDWGIFTSTETDECVDVSDTFLDQTVLPDTVCAGTETTFTFNYPRQIGPYATCGDRTVVNTASFVTNDTGATGEASKSISVHVPCAGGCSLTPGYWKTHSSYGPAPYDDTWALLPHEEGTLFFSSGKTYYEALWTSPRGNAYWILAHAYIAAVLNGLNGADTGAITANLGFAHDFFTLYGPSDSLSRSLRSVVIYNAGVLDNYNNGLIGPGHCSE